MIIHKGRAVDDTVLDPPWVDPSWVTLLGTWFVKDPDVVALELYQAGLSIGMGEEDARALACAG